MAELQYIGARYVPKFYEGIGGSSEWVAGVAYEALTIVTYLNNSYTSKKPVPASVGQPNLNQEYWANTGNYNAQVEAYRQDTQAVEDTINNDVLPTLNLMNDYVVEIGTENNWHYRKWNSGIAECWGVFNFRTTITQVWGSLFASIATDVIQTNYPNGLFSKVDCFVATESGITSADCWVCGHGAGSNTATPLLQLMRATASNGEIGINLSFIAKGRWK